MMGVLKENPSISSKEMIMKVHQKNSQAANMLTKISKMYDIKNDPELHGKFLLMSIQEKDISTQINSLRNEISSLKDDDKKNSIIKKIDELQRLQGDLKLKIKELN